MSDPVSDAALLQAHVAGDPEAFGRLFARHRDRLWAVALRTTQDPEEAADALQDGMMAAFRRAGSYRGDALVTTWLHRIVVNAALDRLRRRQVRLADPLPGPSEPAPRVRDGAPGTGLLRPRADEQPDEAAERSERALLVRDALAQLPVEQRLALVLVDMEGRSVAEAAAVLEVAEGTVKSRCSRGRRRLAELLGPVLSPPSPADARAAGPRETPGGNRPPPTRVPSSPGATVAPTAALPPRGSGTTADDRPDPPPRPRDPTPGGGDTP